MTRWLPGPLVAGTLAVLAVSIASGQQPARPTPREFWNKEFAEGKVLLQKEASPLLRAAIEGRTPGTALDLGMGQGRNALYLAHEGWQVTGVDLSDVAVDQASKSARAQGLRLNAVISDLDAYDFGREQWDLITSFYMHAWHRRSKTDVPQRIYDALRPGGLLVLEGFADPPNTAGLQAEQLDQQFARLRILRNETVTDHAAWYVKEKVPLVRFVAEKPQEATSRRHPSVARLTYRIAALSTASIRNELTAFPPESGEIRSAPRPGPRGDGLSLASGFRRVQRFRSSPQ